jgi:hypothetical protein
MLFCYKRKAQVDGVRPRKRSKITCMKGVRSLLNVRGLTVEEARERKNARQKRMGSGCDVTQRGLLSCWLDLNGLIILRLVREAEFRSMMRQG